MQTLLTVDELAEFLKLKHSTIYNWCHLKKIPYLKVCGVIRFPKDNIDKWLEERKVERDEV